MLSIAISIHALRGEGDGDHRASPISILLFQSTPSVGRATIMSIITFSVCKFQSTPSVGRATFKRAERNANRFGISIHALRGEGDYPQKLSACPREYFNPRPPWGGRPFDRLAHNLEYFISIHALRGEGDFSLLRFYSKFVISIHALRGEGDAFCLFRENSCRYISIHALRGEGD